MIYYNTTIGLLRWFFRPVMLFGGDGDSSSTSSSGGLNSTQKDLMDAFGSGFGIGFGAVDKMKSYEKLSGFTGPIGNQTKVDPFGNTENSFASMEAKLNILDDLYGDLNTAGPIGSSIGGGLFGDQVSISYDANGNMTVTQGGLSATNTYNDGLISSSTTIGYSVNGVTTNSTTNYDSILGIGTNINTNQHYTSSGERLGVIAEGLVDIGDTLGFSLDPDIAQGIGSVFGTALSYVMGVRGVALALSAVVSLVDTKLAEKVIGTEAAINLKTIAMVATTLQTMGQLTVSVEAILSSDYLTVGQKAIAATALGAQGYIAMSGFGGFTGTPGSNISRVFNGFTSSKGDFTGEGYTTLDELWNAYGQWQYETGSSYSLDDVQGDPFEYMAGGETYNAQSAGGPLYLADKARNPREIMDRDLKLSKDDKVRLLQEDGQFVDLQPVNTNTSDRGDVLGVARQGQISQLNRLIKGYTEAIDEYNANVDKYNARTGTLTRAELTTQMNAIEGLGNSITELRTQFNL